MSTRRSPLSPIFRPETRRGSIDVGGTPSTPPFTFPTLVRISSDLNANMVYGGAMTAHDGWLYVGYRDGLASIDITTPGSPVVGELFEPNAAYARWYGLDGLPGDFVLAVEEDGTAIVVDVADPENMAVESVDTDAALSDPIVVAAVTTGFPAGFAFVGNATGVYVVDASTPSSVSIDNSSVGAANSYAVATTADGGTQVFGTPPATNNVYVIGSGGMASDAFLAPALGTVVHAEITSTVAYLLGYTVDEGDYTLIVGTVDVSDPSDISLLDTLTLSVTGEGTPGFCRDGDDLYVLVPTSSDTVTAIRVDASNTSALSEEETTTSVGAVGNPPGCEHIVKVGDYIYYLDGNDPA